MSTTAIATRPNPHRLKQNPIKLKCLKNEINYIIHNKVVIILYFYYVFVELNIITHAKAHIFCTYYVIKRR